MKVFLVLLIILSNVLIVLSQKSEKKPVGRITEVQGIGSLKENDNAKPKELSKKDKGTALFAGQILECKGRCRKISFIIDNAEKDIVNGKSYIIPNKIKPFNSIAYTESATKPYRSEDDVIFSPAENSVILPKTFSLRWDKNNSILSKKFPLTVKIKICNTDSPFFSSENISNFADGIFASELIKRNLIEIQKKNSDDRIEIVIKTAQNETTKFCSKIISSEKEKSLQQDLEKLNNLTTPLARHLQRGYIYFYYNLYAESSDEYASALEISPENPEIIAENILINYRLGNITKVKNLLPFLPKTYPKFKQLQQLIK